MGFKPTTLLDRLRPSVAADVEDTTVTQSRKRLDVGRLPAFSVGDAVFARFWHGTKRWRPGSIVAVAGPLSYDVQVGDQIHRLHATQLFCDRGPFGETPEDEELRADSESEELGRPTPAPEAALSPPAQTVPPALPLPPAAAQPAAPPPLPNGPPPAAPPPSDAPRPAAEPNAKQRAVATDAPKVERLRRTHHSPKRFYEEFSGLGSSKAKY